VAPPASMHLEEAALDNLRDMPFFAGNAELATSNR
jgi:hypothetical protein